MKQRRSKRKLI